MRRAEEPEPSEASASAAARFRRDLFQVGGYAAIVHLVAVAAVLVVEIVLGPTPESAEAYFAVHGRSRLEAVLRGDFLLLFLVGAYLGTVPALYLALRRINHVVVLFASGLMVVAVANVFATESTFALLHLGNAFQAATEDAERVRLLAAADAVVAMDMWHSTAAYLGGVFAQGGGVVLSLVMLRSRDFSRVTALSGLIGNALDLGQHLIHPFVPGVASVVQPIMGVFYVVWFPMLARDFFRLARRQPAP